MNAAQLAEKYKMKPHEENGCYAEQHYAYKGEGRAPSGCSYFYTAPGESTKFHRIDCDEYWCFASGSSLEVWMIDAAGLMEIKQLGTEEDADPVIYFPKGVIFASRNTDPQGEGTFFSCITVPRFDYRGFELVEKEEVLRLNPKAEAFWKE